MSEGDARRIRVTVRAVRILESLDPDKTGEFAFGSSVSSDGQPPVERRYPASGHVRIGDEPVYNRAALEWVIFEGGVAERLTVQLRGGEEDRFGGSEALTEYMREFRGAVADWFGTYGPGEDPGECGNMEDPEMMTDWRITLRIEPA